MARLETGHYAQEVEKRMDTKSAYYDVNAGLSPLAEGFWALLVYSEELLFQGVERALLDQGMRTRRARNCAAARNALGEANPPSLVLTGTSLPDGTWADVLDAAGAVRVGFPVVVVSRVVDIPLYLEVLTGGAYDFVVPPFVPADLAYIVRGAILQGTRPQQYFHRQTDG
jgi:DNA-binding NtrC family response regulator